MTLTKEQLDLLHRRINDRLEEFGCNRFGHLYPGIVRLAFDVIEEWWVEDDPVPAATSELNEERVTMIHDAAFTEGWQAGRESIRREQALMAAAMPNTNGSTTVIAPEPDRIDATGIADDDWCDLPATEGASSAQFWRNLDEAFSADETPPKSDEKLTNEVAAVGQMILPSVAPAVPRRVPDPDVARANIAKMLANGSGGQLIALATRKPGSPLGALADVDKSEVRKGKHGAFLPTLDDVIRELKRQSMAGMMPSQSMFNDAKPGNWAIAIAQTRRLKKSWEELAELAGLKMRQRGPQPRPEAVPGTVPARQAAK